jgi:hypothetical protein
MKKLIKQKESEKRKKILRVVVDEILEGQEVL